MEQEDQADDHDDNRLLDHGAWHQEGSGRLNTYIQRGPAGLRAEPFDVRQGGRPPWPRIPDSGIRSGGVEWANR